jgi:hypothetical protein
MASLAELCTFSNVVVVILVAIVVFAIVMPMMKREHFQMGDAERWAQAPPNLAALPLSPRSNLPGMSAASMFGDSYMQAAPPQPVMGAVGSIAAQGATVDFATMGGGFGGAPDRPAGVLTSAQANDMLQQTMNGGKPEYYEAVLPLGSIEHSTDPTDPKNFMFDRTVFAPLKRQYGNGVDFIRGDIDVKQEYRGWFDVRPATNKDIVTGYFDNYIDIQQQTSIKDAQFTRTTPVQTLFNAAANPAGLQAVAYANV